jgi:hypothetical protein
MSLAPEDEAPSRGQEHIPVTEEVSDLVQPDDVHKTT